MRRLLLAALLVLVLAACGDDSSGDAGGAETDQVDATQQPADDDPPSTTESDTESDTDSTGGSDGDGGEGPSTATVTIDGATYEFTTEGALVAQCLPDLFGVMSVQLPLEGDSSAGLSLIALHDGTDPAVVGQSNAVEVSLPDANWVADPEDVRIAGNPDYEGLSQVDSVTVSGSTVTGTATFVNTDNFDEIESATGTFEATCGEERTS